MRKNILLIINIILISFLIGCTNNKITENKKIDESESEEVIKMDNNLELKIQNTILDVTWYSNESVDALKKLAKDTLTINMNKYGGFEQVGSIGKTLPSNDINITINPGDIVLYSSNQIVIFYGSNTWAYTKLGHINLSKDELEKLLSNSNVTITFTLK